LSAVTSRSFVYRSCCCRRVEEGSGIRSRRAAGEVVGRVPTVADPLVPAAPGAQPSRVGGRSTAAAGEADGRAGAALGDGSDRRCREPGAELSAATASRDQAGARRQHPGATRRR